MKKPSRLCRSSAPGDFALSHPTPQKLRQQKPWSPRFWLAVSGAALLLLLLAQGWLISDSSGSQPVKSASILLSSSSSSSSNRLFVADQGVDVGHLALLDTLWAAVPFTHVVMGADGSKHKAYSFWHHKPVATIPAQQQQQQQQQQEQHPPGSVTSAGPAGTSQPLSDSSSSSSSSRSATAGVHLPTLRLPSHPELNLLHRLVAAIQKTGLTPGQARQAFVSAFQAVAPPRGFPAWQVHQPPNPEAAAAAEAAAQQQQHKGAQYVSTEETDTDSVHNITAAELLKLRPRGRTLTDEAAVAAAAAAAIASLARAATGQQQQHQQQQQQQGASILGQAAAEHLMKYALTLLKASHKLAPCGTDDASMPIDKLMGGPAAPKVVLAVTGAAAGAEAIPNLVMQLLQVCVSGAAVGGWVGGWVTCINVQKYWSCWCSGFQLGAAAVACMVCCKRRQVTFSRGGFAALLWLYYSRWNSSRRVCNGQLWAAAVAFISVARGRRSSHVSSSCFGGRGRMQGDWGVTGIMMAVGRN
jgi:hypothetical protein